MKRNKPKENRREKHTFIQSFECTECGMVNNVRIRKEQLKIVTCRHCYTRFYAELDEFDNTWSWPVQPHPVGDNDG